MDQRKQRSQRRRQSRSQIEATNCTIGKPSTRRIPLTSRTCVHYWRLNPDSEHPLPQNSFELIPPFTLGDNNTVAELQHYVIGPGPLGMVLDTSGRVDEEESFRHLNYFDLFAKQHVRNNPQPQLSPRPIDFHMMPLPDGQFSFRGKPANHAYWLYGDDASQLIIRDRPEAVRSLCFRCKI